AKRTIATTPRLSSISAFFVCDFIYSNPRSEYGSSSLFAVFGLFQSGDLTGTHALSLEGILLAREPDELCLISCKDRCARLTCSYFSRISKEPIPSPAMEEQR